MQKKGRKKLSLNHVFNDEKYLIILYTIFCNNKKLKKKHLKKYLLKENTIDFKNDFEISATSEMFYLYIKYLKSEDYRVGKISKKEFDEFNKISEEQFFQNYRFKNNNDFSKYLSNLKHKVFVLDNKHDTRGTYWDFTVDGLRIFEKTHIVFLLNQLDNETFDKYKDIIKNLIWDLYKIQSLKK